MPSRCQTIEILIQDDEDTPASVEAKEAAIVSSPSSPSSPSDYDNERKITPNSKNDSGSLQNSAAKISKLNTSSATRIDKQKTLNSFFFSKKSTSSSILNRPASKASQNLTKKEGKIISLDQAVVKNTQKKSNSRSNGKSKLDESLENKETKNSINNKNIECTSKASRKDDLRRIATGKTKFNEPSSKEESPPPDALNSKKHKKKRSKTKPYNLPNLLICQYSTSLVTPENLDSQISQVTGTTKQRPSTTTLDNLKKNILSASLSTSTSRTAFCAALPALESKVVAASDSVNNCNNSISTVSCLVDDKAFENKSVHSGVNSNLGTQTTTETPPSVKSLLPDQLPEDQSSQISNTPALSQESEAIERDASPDDLVSCVQPKEGNITRQRIHGKHLEANMDCIKEESDEGTTSEPIPQDSRNSAELEELCPTNKNIQDDHIKITRKGKEPKKIIDAKLKEPEGTGNDALPIQKTSRSSTNKNRKRVKLIHVSPKKSKSCVVLCVDDSHPVSPQINKGSDDRESLGSTMQSSKTTAMKPLETLLKSPKTTEQSSEMTVEPSELTVVSETTVKPSKMIAKQSKTTKPSKITVNPSETMSKPLLTTIIAPDGEENIKENSPSELHETKDVIQCKEYQRLLSKHEAMKATYCLRAADLVKLSSEKLAEDEKCPIPMPSIDENILKNCEGDNGGKYPDQARPHLAALLEGSQLSLSKLVPKVCEALNKEFDKSAISFTEDCIASKIKVLAIRKAYVRTISIKSGTIIGKPSIARNKFEDENKEHMWRWEVISLDLISDANVAVAKKRRSNHRKIALQFHAISKLVISLYESTKLLTKIIFQNHDEESDKSRVDDLLGKISQEEDRVLKFDQAAELARLQAEKKKIKEREVRESKDRTLEERKREKEKADEERKRKNELAAKKKKIEKERAVEEKNRMKEQKRLEAEESKRKKMEEQNKIAKSKKNELQRRKQRMMSFFSADSKSKREKNGASSVAKGGFDEESFRSSINSGVTSDKPFFHKLSKRAVSSRIRRTRRINVRVFATVTSSESAFDAQSYYEEREIEVLNKFRFLQFREDERPAYHGTWSKKSTIVTGRTPFRKDTTHLNYEVDSEAEWEEDDGEIGFDVNDDACDDEDEILDDAGVDSRIYNYEDGWLAEDGELDGEEEADEETTSLRKKKKRARKTEIGVQIQRPAPVVCIIGPSDGGVPLVERYPLVGNKIDEACKDMISGIDVREGYSLLQYHGCMVLNDEPVYLSAFPSTLINEKVDTKSVEQTDQGLSRNSLQIFARFVHHCTLGSRDKVVEEFRKKNKDINSSRAQIFRTLDSICEKKRHPRSGYYWEVKSKSLENLGLEDLKTDSVPPPAAIVESNYMQEMRGDNLITFVRFIHHSTHTSKEKVYEEFRRLNPALGIRALVSRTLDLVAEKKRQGNGVYWEVKEKILTELHLEDLVKEFSSSEKEDTTSSPKKKSIPAKKKRNTPAKKDTPAKKKIKSNESVEKVESETLDSPSINLLNLKKHNIGGNKRKRVAPIVSAASANLLAAFLKKK